jgi:hypothetical protein
MDGQMRVKPGSRNCLQPISTNHQKNPTNKLICVLKIPTDFSNYIPIKKKSEILPANSVKNCAEIFLFYRKNLSE